MDGTTALLEGAAGGPEDGDLQETPETEVLRPALSEEESERDARIRMAITVGVLTMVIVGLAAMAYSFNEAQRQLDYLQDSDHVKPSDLERAWKTASNTTSSVDDLDMVSSPANEDSDKTSLPSTAKSTGEGFQKTDVTPDSDDGTE
ncbi:hypothetical protein MRX96_008017 [Rhipicephalus microplus]